MFSVSYICENKLSVLISAAHSLSEWQVIQQTHWQKLGLSSVACGLTSRAKMCNYYCLRKV
jgi:hypothetical protein